jgi:hypothetical protein
MRISRLIPLVCALAAPTLLLAASPWDGTWKLDLSKSHFEGQSFTYSKGANGMWHIKAGNVAYDFGMDGKPYPTVDADDTVAATMKGDHTIRFENGFKGKVMSVTEETLSADGKTITDHSTGTRPDGSKIDETTVSTRVSGGPGFIGTWKSTKVSTDHASTYNISTAADGTLTWDIPDYKNTYKGKPDGVPTQLSGPTVPSGLMMSTKKVSPTELTYTITMKGKTLDEGHVVLVDGGKAMKDTSWNPGAPTEKTVGYYTKQ